MNRIIVVGNGFDLAHGYPTRYIDFLEYYIIQSIKTGTSSLFKKSDPLIKMSQLRSGVFDQFSEGVIDEITSDILTSPGRYPLEKRFDYYNLNIQFDPLLYKLLKSCHDLKWVDIENVYYKSLLQFVNRSGDQYSHRSIKELNDSFRHLTKMLREYLLTINIRIHDQFLYRGLFCDEFEVRDFDYGLVKPEEKPEKIIVVNFNYTTTPNNYFNFNTASEVDIINIHGTLNSRENPIIFGFGDEIDENYKSIENIGDNEYLQFFKSFWYLNTRNYRNLLDYIDSGPYEVRLFGHSCGLSDRTLLRTIFSNKNCLSVRPYYHGDTQKNNYPDIIHDLSRHFSSAERFRRIVVSRQDCFGMPQL